MACKETKTDKIKHSSFTLKLGNTWQVMDLDSQVNTGYFTAENKRINKSGILTLTYSKDPISTTNYLNSMKREIEENPIFKLGNTQFKPSKQFTHETINGEIIEYQANLQGLEVVGLIFVTKCTPFSYCFLYQQNKKKQLESNFISLLEGFDCNN